MNDRGDQRGLISSATLDKSRQLFKEITDRLGRVGKDGYAAAVSTIGISRKAGKTTVLRMEINATRMKMKKLFTKLGEAAYDVGAHKAADILQEASLQSIINEIKSYDAEIKEIEQYIDSLEGSRITDIFATGKINSRENVPAADNSLEGLKAMKPADSMAAHVEALKDKDVNVRVEALKELFRFEGTEAVPHLISALRDKNAGVRRRSASYLGWKVAVSAAPDLMIAANDRISSVRKASLEALGELGTKEAVPVLIKGLDDRDIEVRKSAYKALTKVTGEFIDFNADGSLSERFKSLQKWEKWWEREKK